MHCSSLPSPTHGSHSLCCMDHYLHFRPPPSTLPAAQATPAEAGAAVLPEAAVVQGPARAAPRGHSSRRTGTSNRKENSERESSGQPAARKEEEEVNEQS